MKKGGIHPVEKSTEASFWQRSQEENQIRGINLYLEKHRKIK